jgi:hypothetical protein
MGERVCAAQDMAARCHWTRNIFLHAGRSSRIGGTLQGSILALSWEMSN